MRTRPCCLVLVFWASLCSAAAADDLLLVPHAGEAPVGPLPFTPSVRGVTLNLRRTFFFSRVEGAGGASAHVRLLVDLSDVQSQGKLRQLVATLPLPTNECARAGINLVAGISSQTLTVAGSRATLRLAGQVDAWLCELPLKTTIGQQPVTITLPLRLRVASEHAIALAFDPPHVELGGSLAQATDLALHFLNVDLDLLLTDAITRAVNPDLLQWSLPPELEAAHPTLNAAELLANGDGTLLTSLEMTVPLSLDGLFHGSPPPHLGHPSERLGR